MLKQCKAAVIDGEIREIRKYGLRDLLNIWMNPESIPDHWKSEFIVPLLESECKNYWISFPSVPVKVFGRIHI